LNTDVNALQRQLLDHKTKHMTSINAAAISAQQQQQQLIQKEKGWLVA
jgi:hypothetical protein